MNVKVLILAALLRHPVGAQRPKDDPILLRRDLLAMGKQRARVGDARYKPAYDELLRDADAAMKLPPFTVMAKHRTPPSGDKHDYMSLAPYWWPDSTKPNGVPFIRRDGEVNPESRLDTDSPRFLRFADAVEALTLAYYMSDEAKYAARAELLLRTWFLDSATRMNANLRFAQAIPGVTEGRGIGIIDTRNLATIIDDVLLLHGAPGWTAADETGIRNWMRAYLDWLQTSPQGKEEAIQRNNHGTWYDAQLASIALFVGDTALARRTIANAGPTRIATQIEADGRQPEELARTRPIHYSLFNIEPFARLAELGRHVGVDLWRYKAPNGASLLQAVRFVSPYFDTTVVWSGKEVTPAHPEEFLRTVRQAATVYQDSGIDAALQRMPRNALVTDRSILLYPAVGAPAGAAIESLLPRALALADEHLRRAATQLDPSAGFPRATRADGTWDVLPATAWTSGFFAGSLWQMYDLTKEPFWKTAAERWTAPLADNARRTNTHDLGFLIFDSFGQGMRLGGEAGYRDVVLTASRSLASRFNERAGAIKSWDTDGVTDGRKKWAFPVIIDNMMNLEMLFWAAAQGGDPRWKEIAERHALTTARTHVREDGSTAHVASFDPKSGAFLGRATWQGLNDGSTWGRGQAWAIHGFTDAYVATHNPKLLETAKRAADWYLSHLPSDGIPYWDFSAPQAAPTERDVSAAAIAVSGLFELARQVSEGEGERYRQMADRMLGSLLESYADTRPGSMALLRHAVGQRPQGAEIDVGIVYADYYLLEAMRRRRM